LARVGSACGSIPFLGRPCGARGPGMPEVTTERRRPGLKLGCREPLRTFHEVHRSLASGDDAATGVEREAFGSVGYVFSRPAGNLPGADVVLEALVEREALRATQRLRAKGPRKSQERMVSPTTDDFTGGASAFQGTYQGRSRAMAENRCLGTRRLVTHQGKR